MINVANVKEPGHDAQVKDIVEDIERYMINLPYTSFTTDGRVFSVEIRELPSKNGGLLGYSLNVVAEELATIDFWFFVIQQYLEEKQDDKDIMYQALIFENKGEVNHFPRKFSLAKPKDLGLVP